METNCNNYCGLVCSWINALMITTTTSLSVLIKPRIIGSKGRTFKKLTFGKYKRKMPKLRFRAMRIFK